eukprot:s270_g27.t1
MGVATYSDIAAQLSSERFPEVLEDLEQLHRTSQYWICAFCINQHSCICSGFGVEPMLGTPQFDEWDSKRRDTVTGHVYPLCRCSHPKYLNPSPNECEMNKFDDMIHLLHSQVPNFSLVASVDYYFQIFMRIRSTAVGPLAGENVFTALFTMDVVVRIFILRCKFFRVYMNYIDIAVTVASLTELVIFHAVDLPVNPILFRLLRIGKLARAIRMVTMNSVLASLQLLIKCIAASMNMLFWSFCLLTFVQCVAGMVASTLCRDFIENENVDVELRREVFRYYGTFTRTFLTMFETLFANWGPPCRVVVENISEWFSLFFLSYRCVLGFAVLNVVNAVFVQQTMKTASSDEELAFKQKERDVALYTRKVKKLFMTMDSSGDGTINKEEFSKLVNSPMLKFWMGQLELEYHDLMSLFEFLDNGDGEITLMEFIDGAARLKGGAKALDIWRIETKLEVLLGDVLSTLKGAWEVGGEKGRATSWEASQDWSMGGSPPDSNGSKVEINMFHEDFGVE